MRKSLLIMIIALAYAINSAAIGVTCDSAGQLSSLVTDTSVGELTVAGTIDVRDIDFIASQLTSLTQLDLGDASINGYDCHGDETYFGQAGSFAANTLPAFSFFGKQYISLILPSTLTTLGEASLAGTSQLSGITLPASLTAIGDYALNGSGITQVAVPVGITTMGRGAFAGCHQLLTVEISSSKIGEEAFARCPLLQQATLAASVSEIGDGAFAGCGNLASVKIAANSTLLTIGDCAFIDTPLSGNPFEEATEVESVGSWAFANTQMSQFFLPDAMNEVPTGAYFNARHIENIEMPAGTVSIGDYALYGCNSVASFSIPAGVETMGDYAIAAMKGLSSIIAHPVTPPALQGENTFAGINQPTVTLFVDDTVVPLYQSADYWKAFNVTGTSSVQQIEPGAEATVKAYFTGKTLNLHCDTEMSQVMIADLSGAIVAQLLPRLSMVTINTSAWSGNFYVARVTLADGTIKTIKLIR